jgi:signal transduction histidine kinase
MAEINRFTVHFDEDGLAEPKTEDTRFLLFECVRELLFNAHKHSGAGEASVRMTRSSGNGIVIEVSDKGKGFYPEITREIGGGRSSFGLYSIKQRLSHISGRMEIDTAPGK